VKTLYCLVVFLWIVSSNTVFAIAPISGEVIKHAQDYGTNHSASSLFEFLQPWMAYEEKAVKLDETAEHAYLYTMFLLLATDAREKKSSGKPVGFLDSERIIADYSGTLSFSVALFGNEPTFARNAKATIKQGDKAIQAYHITTPTEAEKCTWLPGRSFMVQSYFYFSDSDIDTTKPIILTVVTNDKHEHRFYFDLAKVK